MAGLITLLVLGALLILFLSLGYALYKTNRSILATLIILSGLGILVFLGALLAMVGGGGMIMAPTLPRKLFALFLFLPGLWLLFLFLTISIGILFQKEDEPLHPILQMMFTIFCNPASLLSERKPSQNLFKYSSENKHRLEIRPYWQISLLTALFMLSLFGLGTLMAWADYSSKKAQGYGLMLILISLPFIFLTVKKLVSALCGEECLLIEQTGFSTPGLKFKPISYQWDEVNEFKIIDRGNNEFICFTTHSGKEGFLPNTFPISNQDLLLLMKNRQEHYLVGSPLEDPMQYKASRWWEHPFAILFLLCLPIFALLYALVFTQVYPEAKAFF